MDKFNSNERAIGLIVGEFKMMDNSRLKEVGCSLKDKFLLIINEFDLVAEEHAHAISTNEKCEVGDAKINLLISLKATCNVIDEDT